MKTIINKPKLLVASPFHTTLLDQLNSNFLVTYIPNARKIDIDSIIDQYECIIIATKPGLDQTILSKAHQLKMIIRLGIGIDHINIEYCREHNIIVAITPNSNIAPVLELVFSKLVYVLRNFDGATNNLFSGHFRDHLESGNELNSKTIGVIGTGRIGSNICRLASLFGMKVLAYDPYIADKYRIQALFVEKDVLISQSDIISIHTPHTIETDNMVDFDFLELMKKDSILINTARGRIAPMKTLIEYSKREKIKNFIIDVYDNEPFIPDNNDIFLLKKYFTLSPHIGAFTEQSLLNRSQEALIQLNDYFNNNKLPHGIIDLLKGY